MVLWNGKLSIVGARENPVAYGLDLRVRSLQSEEGCDLILKACQLLTFIAFFGGVGLMGC